MLCFLQDKRLRVSGMSGNQLIPLSQDDLDVMRHGLRNGYLGRHVLAEFWGCRNVHDPEYVERSLVRAAEDAGAVVLGVHVHHFGGNMGVTGVAMLAQSHLSIHSWPEVGYAAIDIFVCGLADPYRAIASLRISFQPNDCEIRECRRGRIHAESS